MLLRRDTVAGSTAFFGRGLYSFTVKREPERQVMWAERHQSGQIALRAGDGEPIEEFVSPQGFDTLMSGPPLFMQLRA